MKKVKIVGTQKFINAETGEEVIATVEVVETDRRFGWEAVWLNTLLETLDLISNKSFKVAKFLLEERTRGENLIIATIPEIAKKVGVSETTVKRTIKKLIEAKFIVKIQKGVYRLNPAIIWRGYEDKRQAILIKFQSEKLKEEAKKKRDSGQPKIPKPLNLDPSTFEEIFVEEVKDERKA